MKVKTRKITLLSLILAAALCIAAVFGMHFIKADADGTVTVNGSNVFTAAGEANVIADRQEFDPEEGSESTEKVVKYYTMFSLAYENDSVSYRKNLAYNWYEADEDGNGVNKLFNMTVGFKNSAYERFVIKFESQLYEKKDKETKSVNYVIFYPVEGDSGKVYALITDKEDDELPETKTALSADKLEIKFTEKVTGGYKVCIEDGEGVSVDGEFKNVGGNYAKSSTSTTSPVYPLIFKAEFSDEETDGRQSAQMVLYSLNGQSFELNGSTPTYNEANNYYYGGSVTDNTPPVLCLEQELNYLTLGKEVEVQYAVIDVLRSSPRATANFYVLTYDQYAEYNEETDYDDKDLFTEISSDKDYLLESGKDKYFPVEANAEVFDEYLKADMAAKVYFTLTDVTSNGSSCDVYLQWYLSDKFKLEINGSTFIAVCKDEIGATYSYDDDGKWSTADDGKVAQYQKKVDEIAKDLSAGSSSYIYLPSAEELFADNATAYEDLKISIYYYNTTQQSNTSLATNNLSINITTQGDYVFTLYATDAAGNNMYYLDKDGEVKEFSTSEVWTMFKDEDKEGLYEILPWFTFSVGYTGVKFEETPGLQSTAYVGTAYGNASFKINGISGSYSTVYRLFIFDRADYYNETKTNLSYEEYVERIEELYEDTHTRTFFREIPALADMEETDPDYEKYSAYEWNKTSTTFTPQDENAFYLIRAEVTDNQYNTDPVACNLGVVASVQAKTLKGESDWAKNNVASIVLLCVAGLALIGIVLLLVIKPKNEGDVDEQYEKVKNKKK